MTQRNIDIMDKLVDMLIEGDTISAALGKVYTKRKLRIPYIEEVLNVSVQKIGLPQRISNSCMRTRLHTLNDVVKYCKDNSIKNIKGLGEKSGSELFEYILDYCWKKMDNQTRIDFLIDTVERNEKFIRI